MNCWDGRVPYCELWINTWICSFKFSFSSPSSSRANFRATVWPKCSSSLSFDLFGEIVGPGGIFSTICSAALIRHSSVVSFFVVFFTGFLGVSGSWATLHAESRSSSTVKLQTLGLSDISDLLKTWVTCNTATMSEMLSQLPSPSAVSTPTLCHTPSQNMCASFPTSSARRTLLKYYRRKNKNSTGKKTEISNSYMSSFSAF